jgi:membrane protease YdiL (CAAX protease family)
MSTPFLEVAARGQNQWWRYALTTVVLLVTFLLVQVASTIVTVASGLVDLKTGEMVGTLPPWLFFAMTAAFPMLGGALLLCVKLIHRRSPSTLLGPGGSLRWPVLIRTGATIFALLGVVTLLQWWLSPGRLRLTFEPQGFLLMLPLVLLLVPLQAATEELFFRGWLMQGLGRGGRWAWPAVVINSGIFALVHLGGGFIEGGLGALDLFYFFGIGALASWVTLRDGRLERAIGLHVGLNLFGFTVVGNESPMVELPTIITDKLVTNDPINMAGLVAVAATIWLTDRWARRETSARTGQAEYVAPVTLR